MGGITIIMKSFWHRKRRMLILAHQPSFYFKWHLKGGFHMGYIGGLFWSHFSQDIPTAQSISWPESASFYGICLTCGNLHTWAYFSAFLSPHRPVMVHPVKHQSSKFLKKETGAKWMYIYISELLRTNISLSRISLLVAVLGQA